MWQAIAEETLHCTECRHEIPTGTECLSQMPLQMPETFSRRKYDNFCINCATCSEAKASAGDQALACYPRSLNHWYTYKEKTKDSVCCGQCGEHIREGTWTFAQKIYAWPGAALGYEVNAEAERKNGTFSGAVGGAASKPQAAEWHNLDKATQLRFRRSGLRRGMGARSETMARRLYERIIPRSVRNSGPDAVRDAISKKHFSHIRSVRNALGLAKAPSNVVLENPGPNLSRRSQNMTTVEVSAAEAANRISAVKIGAKTLVKGGLKAGLITAVMEAAVSVPENILHYRRGRKSGKRAAEDTAKNTAIAAGTGTVAAIAMKGAALAGIGLSVGPFGTPLAIVGGTLLAGNIIYRITKAARRDIPLDEYRIYFCKNNLCKNSFASNITRKAREARKNPYSGLSITSRIAALALRLWNSLKAPRRVGHKLQVDECRLNGGVSKPA